MNSCGVIYRFTRESEMSDTMINQYVNEVACNLQCSKRLKTKFLQGLKREFSEYAGLTYEQLCATRCTPREMAEQLMDTIGNDEIKQVRRERRLQFGSVVAILIILIGILGGYSAGMYQKFNRPNTFVKVDEAPVEFNSSITKN